MAIPWIIFQKLVFGEVFMWKKRKNLLIYTSLFFVLECFSKVPFHDFIRNHWLYIVKLTYQKQPPEVFYEKRCS